MLSSLIRGVYDRVRYCYAWIYGLLRFLVIWLEHKWYVYCFGRLLRVPLWRLLIHDAAKLHPKEVFGYVAGYYLKDNDGSHTTAASRGALLKAAYAHHCIRCTHHSEHYIDGHSTTATVAPPADGQQRAPNVRAMPPDCVREMIADWCAAQLSYSKSSQGEWSLSSLIAAIWSLATPTKGFRLVSTWFARNVNDTMILHPDTTRCIIASLRGQDRLAFDPRVIELFEQHSSMKKSE